MDRVHSELEVAQVMLRSCDRHLVIHGKLIDMLAVIRDDDDDLDVLTHFLQEAYADMGELAEALCHRVLLLTPGWPPQEESEPEDDHLEEAD